MNKVFLSSTVTTSTAISSFQRTVARHIMTPMYCRSFASASSKPFPTEKATRTPGVPLRQQVLFGYRRLLKAAKVAFRNDTAMLSNAKIQLKQEFLNQKGVSNPQEIETLLRGVDEAEEVLLYQLVQGERNDDGNYEVSFTPEHLVAIEHDQRLPHGPELSPIDTSVVGSPVIVTQVSNKNKQRLENPVVLDINNKVIETTTTTNK